MLTSCCLLPIVVSAASVIAAPGSLADRYLSQLQLAAPPLQTPAHQSAATTATPDEGALKERIKADPNDPTNYFMLALLYERSGDVRRAEATYDEAVKAAPTDPQCYVQLAAFHGRQRDFEKTIEALKRRVAVQPDNSEAPYVVAVYYWNHLRHTTLSTEQRRVMTATAMEYVDAALTRRPQYPEALVYKSLLLRSQSALEADLGVRAGLEEEATRLNTLALELRSTRPFKPPRTPRGEGRSSHTAVTEDATPRGPAPTIYEQSEPGVTLPELLTTIRLLYPSAAIEAQLRGKAVATCVVGLDGRVQDVQVTGLGPLNPELLAQALSIARELVFRPGLKAGKPVLFRMKIPF